jgi:SEC-C motif domain protein
MICPCGTGKNFDRCCEPYLAGKALPETAEQLMRSRYTAFTRADMEYIKNTLAPEARGDFDVAGNKRWAQESKWKGLKVISAEKGTAADKRGTVEFTATYEHGEDAVDHHEVAQFRKDESGQWLFVEGDAHTHKAGEGHHHHHEPIQPVVRATPKIGRNDPCHCGSGKKYKKCHGAAEG